MAYQVNNSLLLERGDMMGSGAPNWTLSGIRLPSDVVKVCSQSLEEQELLNASITENTVLLTAARRSGITYTHKYRVAEAHYVLACAIPRHRIAIEVDGDWAVTPDGSPSLQTRLRRRHLHLLGWDVRAAANDDWEMMKCGRNTEDIETWLRQAAQP